VLTGCYNFTDRARRFGNLDLAARLDAAFAGAKKLHPDFADFVDRDLGLSIAWQNVPHLNGGWADWTKDQVREYRRLLLPDRRFWVVGDQVSYLPGWQEGAMLSAHHVVRQVGEMAAGRATATVGPVVEGLEEAPETRRLIEGFRLPQ
jgi:monoamine oxidase